MSQITYATNVYDQIIKATAPMVVTRDGEIVSPVFDSGNEAGRWLLRHQGQSVAYALTYGGYGIRSLTNS